MERVLHMNSNDGLQEMVVIPVGETGHRDISVVGNMGGLAVGGSLNLTVKTIEPMLREREVLEVFKIVEGLIKRVMKERRDDLRTQAAEDGWKAPQPVPCLKQLPEAWPHWKNLPFRVVRRRLLLKGICITALILVVNDRELKAVSRRLTGLEGSKGSIYTCFSSEYKQSYVLGMFGKFPTVVVQTAMAGGGMQGDAVVAIKLWRPKIVFNVGVAWGGDPDRQKMGDVLVSETVVPFGDNMKIANGRFKNRNKVAEASDMLARAATSVMYSWASDSTLKWNKEWYPIGDDRRGEGEEPFQVHIGKLFSGGILLNDKQVKEAILAIPDYEDVEGGEMEGYGLYQAAKLCGLREWIVVKGICDWGCSKEDGWQPLAAATATDFVLHLLSGPVLADLVPKRRRLFPFLRRVLACFTRSGKPRKDLGSAQVLPITNGTSTSR